MYQIDTLVQQYISLVRTPAATEVMYLISSVFDVSWSFVALVMCVAFLIYRFRNKVYSSFFLGSLVVGGLCVYLLKNYFNVNRPPDGVMFAFGQSFPSYHATISTIFFVMLMYIFDDYFRGFWRVVFNVLCIGLLFLVAISRVYLGVHWVSDVAFGILLGMCVSYVSILGFRKIAYAKK